MSEYKYALFNIANKCALVYVIINKKIQLPANVYMTNAVPIIG